jgi:hypothetical protein
MLVLVVIAWENFDSGHFELFNFLEQWLLRPAFLAGIKPSDVIMHKVYCTKFDMHPQNNKGFIGAIRASLFRFIATESREIYLGTTIPSHQVKFRSSQFSLAHSCK